MTIISKNNQLNIFHQRTLVINKSIMVVSKMYPSGIQFKNRSKVSRVAFINEVFCASSRISEHNLKISENSPHIWFFKFFVLACVICSAEKSKISSERSLRITMLFSHNERFDFDDSTSSGMNVGQLWGHSCLSICSDALNMRH